MKNKKENALTEKILQFVGNNPKCEVATLIKKTGIAKSTAYGILKSLREAGKLNYTNKLYTLAEEPATIKSPKKVKPVTKHENVKTVEKVVETPKEAVEVEKVVETPKEAVEKVVETPKEAVEVEKVKTDEKVVVAPDTTEAVTDGKNFGRDFKKLIFNGQEYRKGKWVHAVLAAYVSANPKVTYTELKTLFPDHLVRTFGLFRKSEEARKINIVGKQRYHGRRDMILVLGCGTKVSVTNQISRDNFPGIVEAYKNAGIITDVEYVLEA